MKTFDVLSQEQCVHQNYLLEASAGTGKTFSIENIVVRLLIEREGISLENMLIVTFTRAAALDLRTRIRENIATAIQTLTRQTPENAPDFLLPFLEKGAEAIRPAKRRLEHALYHFEQAKISTIHAFCARILREYAWECGLSLNAIAAEETGNNALAERVLHDFLRTEVRPELVSPEQMSILLNEYDGDWDRLEKALLNLITKRLEIEPTPAFHEELHAFQQARQQLPKFESEKILADYALLAPYYKELLYKNNTLKEEPLKSAQKLADVFAKDAWEAIDLDTLLGEGLFFPEIFNEEKRNKKKPTLPPRESLHYPDLCNLLQLHLGPLVTRARTPQAILARLAHHCKKLLQKRQWEEEQLGMDELLSATYQALLEKPEFGRKVRQSFKAAIIDEFQDTDPLQWEIFHNLFLQPDYKGYLYLVGDPKQSIYAFRQADIYTYLQAADAIGPQNLASLDTNFRSEAELVRALNTLFCAQNAPNWLALPRKKSALTYHEVHSAPCNQQTKLQDEYGSIHFCLSPVEPVTSLEAFETDYFFPFMASEMIRLHAEQALKWSDCAVLVADRFQGERAANMLKSCGIPVCVQKAANLKEAPAFTAMQELLRAVLQPRHESAIKIALGGRLIGWNYIQILGLATETSYERTLLGFYRLHQTLYFKGFYAFVSQFLQSTWHDDGQNVMQKLLSQEEGATLLQDFTEICHLLIEHQRLEKSHPEELLQYLEQIQDDDNLLQRSQDKTQDNVNILTIHSSKGLEYGVVFAPGLIKRTKQQDFIIPIVNKNRTILTAILDPADPRFHEFLEECDAEKMRQLYVALTRAKYRLYLPFIRLKKQPEKGQASPMELFSARLGQPQAAYDELYARITHELQDQLQTFLDTSQASITHACLKRETNPPTFTAHTTAPNLIKPPTLFLNAPPQTITSFSRLAKHLELQAKEHTPPSDYANPIKNFHTLPSGPDTGTFLHKIFEDLPWNNSDLSTFIESSLKHTPFVGWEETILSMVQQALQTEIPNKGFCLRDVPETALYRETEFLFPNPTGYIKGVIDLMFQHNNEFFILDWKSNWLGPTSDFYQQDRLHIAMEEHQYFLQAKIYSEATQRYMRVIKQHHLTFGGVIYLFLRGSPGIYMLQPEEL